MGSVLRTRPRVRAGEWASRSVLMGNKWTPRKLGASLLGWWSADRPDLISLSGSQVTGWKDAVAAYNLTQGVAGARPLYSAISFNGAPGVTFDGVDDYLELAAVPFPTGAAPSEIHAIVDQTALVADTGTKVVFAYGSTVAFTRNLSRNVNAGQNTLAASAGNGAANVAASQLNDFSGRHVVRGIIDGAQVTANADGVSGGPQNVVPATAATRTRMGGRTATTADQFFQGVIREVIVTGLLSASQAAALQAYMQTKRKP